MNVKDGAVLALIVDMGECIWVSRRYPLRGSEKVPTASLRRLTTEGYIEVESRNISVWKYGPRDSYKGMYNSQLQLNVAILETMDEPTLRTRTEVRAIPTARGREQARALGLLD